MHGLAEIRNRSSSNEEFWLKATAEGALSSFWTTALFRLCLFRNEHPRLKWLEVSMFVLGAVGFALWSGRFVPENPVGAVGILLLALTVLIPLELLVLWFEDLRLSIFGWQQ